MNNKIKVKTLIKQLQKLESEGLKELLIETESGELFVSSLDMEGMFLREEEDFD